MKKYSIIIPHKNCTSLLSKCLNSIPARDDIEAIVVDDNSDNKEEVEEVCKNVGYDCKIIFSETNLGAGPARNKGMSIAQGEWVAFCDADDYFIKENFNKVLSKYASSDADIVFFDVDCIISATGEKSGLIKEQYSDKVHSKNDAENLCRYTLQVPWGKLLKRNLVYKYNIVFSDQVVGEDAFFSLMSGFYANKIVIDLTKAYVYVVHNNSLSSRKFPHEISELLFDKVIERNKFKESHSLYKYRVNLFVRIPGLVKDGFPLIHTFTKVIKNTPIRCMAKDIIGMFRLMLRRLL